MKTKNSKLSAKRLVSEAKRNAIVRRALNGKKSRKELAEQYGVKVDTLNTWVRRYGSTVTGTTKPVVTNTPASIHPKKISKDTEKDIAKVAELLLEVSDRIGVTETFKRLLKMRK
jgi:transposase-like protein